MEALTELIERVVMLENRLANQMVHGKVKEVDTKKQLARLQIGGTEQEPFLSPWVPYAQQAGAFKGHVPPSVGQNMTMFAPTGDPEQSVLLPLSWNKDNKSPSEKSDENVWTFGGWRIELKAGEIVVKNGATEITLTASKVSIKSTDIYHIGNTASGVDGEQKPIKVTTEGGPAEKFWSKV